MQVAVPTRFDAWLRGLGAGGGERRWVLSLAASARPARPARELHGAGAAPPGLIVVSGPEGGLAPEEEAAALAYGFVPVSLGPRTLRADTAPLALLAWLGLAGAKGRE